MNLILRGIKYQNFQIFNGDTLAEDNFGDRKFRVQVANPPYSANIARPDLMPEDSRFNSYGKYAPKSKADFAFLQHMVYHMDDDGRIAVLLPHGVLFRGGAEETIRRYMIEKLNVIDTIIGLPANLFFGTGIPVAIIVCKKNRNGNSNDILFIDASKEFIPGKNQNVLTDDHINKIYKAYQERRDVERFAHVASMEEVAENNFNLNIPRYVDISEPEPEIDIAQVQADIADIHKRKNEAMAEFNSMMRLLGL
jgi:type I restriction enzyme M protein